MMNFLEKSCQMIHENGKNQTGFPTGSILPAYSGNNISNLAGSISGWLDVPEFGENPLLAEYSIDSSKKYDQVILFILDGLSLDLFQTILTGETENSNKQKIWKNLQAEALFGALTSVAPSTTASALTSIWTGYPPISHGVIGYEMWLKEMGIIANMISLSPATSTGDYGGLRKSGFQPKTFLPKIALNTHLSQNQVECYSIQHKSIAFSGLSEMLLQDAKMIPYRTTVDCWVNLAEIIRKGGHKKKFVSVYWGDLDDLSHLYGPSDERVFLELNMFSQMLDWFLKQTPQQGKKTLLIFTADHGFIHTPPAARFDLKNHPDFLKMLTMYPSGETRFAYLFNKVNQENDIRDYLVRHWPGQFQLISAEESLKAGIFGSGKVHPSIEDRMGNWIVIPSSNAYLYWGKNENVLHGRHGGLNPGEMLVPFFMIEL